MSSNKGVKRTLIMKYGKKCFIEELGIRTQEEIEAERKRYKSKKQRVIMDELTYHHIVEKSRRAERQRKVTGRFWETLIISGSIDSQKKDKQR